MIRHLQYNYRKGPSSFLDDPDSALHVSIKECNPKSNMYDIFTIVENGNDNFYSPIIVDKDKYISFNSKILESYPSFKNMLDTIREDTDQAIRRFMDSGGTIRDLLYRINTIDPIERECMNRGNKLTTFNDNYNNFTGNYLNTGKDDMVTTGLMSHEIEAILLYLLEGSNVNINIHYSVHDILNFVYKVSGFKEHISQYSSFNPIPSYKWFYLQSLYDSSFVKKIPYVSEIDKNNINDYITNPQDSTLGSIYFNKDISCSLAMLVLRLYKNNRRFCNEVRHNLCRIPVFKPHHLSHLDKNGKIGEKYKYEIAYYYISESFRKIMHTSTMILYQLIVFNFMDYMLSNNINNIKIQNPIDRVLFQDREFQSSWIVIEENYSREEMFKEFKNYLTKLLVEEE